MFGLTFENQLNIIHRINKPKKKTHMIVSIDGEYTSDKIQRASWENTDNILSETPNAFLLRSEQGWYMLPLIYIIFNYLLR